MEKKREGGKEGVAWEGNEGIFLGSITIIMYKRKQTQNNIKFILLRI